MSTSFSCSNSFSTLDPLPPSEQLCYVHCNICDTVLAVLVPCTSLFKTVTVRCGHCTNLLPVNMRGLIIQSSSTNYHHPHLNFAHSFFSPSPPPPPSPNLLEEFQNPNAPDYLINQINANSNSDFNSINLINGGIRVADHRRELPRPPVMNNKPPEKRQRVPSAYNRFIKDEIQRIKVGNPDISHREAFSTAAKNWAHFPQIHFGLLPDQTTKKTNTRQQEGGDRHAVMKDGLFAAAANVGVTTPF